jgi:hypothetical protein
LLVVLVWQAVPLRVLLAQRMLGVVLVSRFPAVPVVVAQLLLTLLVALKLAVAGSQPLLEVLPDQIAAVMDFSALRHLVHQAVLAAVQAMQA